MQNCISTDSLQNLLVKFIMKSRDSLGVRYRFSTESAPPPLKMWSKTPKPLIYKGKKANFKFALGVCQSKELMIF